ncbi:GNAT family N-acetyltransferase [Candidatus Roizmanbacteria bacterium]|nr:GNAT family N-acetyltransferase [Candidatus Roizmanbacteria bacterium]
MNSKPSIQILQKNELDVFFAAFSHILTTEFTQYEKNVVRYLLDKIYSLDNYKYWLENNLKTILIATCHPEFISGSDNKMLKQVQHDNYQIVGFAVIDEPYGGVSLCRWLGVSKSYQNKGIGTTLIRQWLELATSQGCHKVELAAVTSAKHFYEKAGLELEGLRKLSYFGIDQYVFGKIIGKVKESSIIR